MALGLLGMMAAGGATAYADSENRRVQEENHLKSAIFTMEAQEAFQMRREERAAGREGAMYQRQREDLLADEERKFDREGALLETRQQHELTKLDRQAARAKELEGMRQSGQDRRAQMRIGASTARAGTEVNGVNMDAIRKRIGDAEDKIVKLRETLTDPMKARDPDLKAATEDRIRRLRGEIRSAEREMLDAQLPPTGANLSDIFKNIIKSAPPQE